MTIRLISQVYVGQGPIFYGPANLLHVLKIIYSRRVVFGMIDLCHSETDIVNYIFISLSITLKYFIIKKWRRLGGIRDPLGTCCGLDIIMKYFEVYSV